mmetsp:Transcript_14221/g.44423  ORF Transcript_14221/g.44423 Transcript_14221/m.44423 type:complete len:228 (-) Transcript_14221:302-985(-)
MAVRMLDACAFCPPIEPASALPMRFLCTLSRATAAGVVLRTEATTDAGRMASAATLFPRPSIQLIADGFLSVHMLPERPRSWVPGYFSRIDSTTLFTPLETMFMPIASPVKHLKRTCAYLPAMPTFTASSRPKRLVALKARLSSSSDAGSSSHRFSSAAALRLGIARAGARVMPSARSSVVAPPDAEIARAPRCVDATSAPSVVAIGTYTALPSILYGPMVPTGSGT